MSAELKVILVGDDPQQQQAFNRPESILPSEPSRQEPSGIPSESDARRQGEASGMASTQPPQPPSQPPTQPGRDPEGSRTDSTAHEQQFYQRVGDFFSRITASIERFFSGQSAGVQRQDPTPTPPTPGTHRIEPPEPPPIQPPARTNEPPEPPPVVMPDASVLYQSISDFVGDLDRLIDDRTRYAMRKADRPTAATVESKPDSRWRDAPPTATPATNAPTDKETLSGSPDAQFQGDVVRLLSALVDRTNAVVHAIQARAGQRINVATAGANRERTDQAGQSSLFRDAFESLRNRIQNTRVGRVATRSIERGRGLVRRAAASRLGRRVARSRAGQAIAKRAGGMLARFGIGSAARTAVGAGAGMAAGGGAGGAAAGAAGAAGGGAAAGAALLGPVGVAIGVTAASFAFAALTIKAFNDAILSATHDLKEFSPHLQMADAQHEVTMDLKRMDRAEDLGPEMATILEANYHLDEAMYDLQTQILALLLKFSPVIETAVDGVTLLASLATQIVASLQMQYALLNNLWGNFGDDAKAKQDLINATLKLNKAFQEFLDLSQDPADMQDPWLDALFGAQGPGAKQLNPQQIAGAWNRRNKGNRLPKGP